MKKNALFLTLRAAASVLPFILFVAASSAQEPGVNVIANLGLDGYNMTGPMMFDKAGNIYGTTFYGGYTGGVWGDGTIFKLTKKADGIWTRQVLHDFGTVRYDGEFPSLGSVALDDAGNLYCATSSGAPTMREHSLNSRPPPMAAGPRPSFTILERLPRMDLVLTVVFCWTAQEISMAPPTWEVLSDVELSSCWLCRKMAAAILGDLRLHSRWGPTVLAVLRFDNGSGQPLWGDRFKCGLQVIPWAGWNVESYRIPHLARVSLRGGNS
jgi:hypothetical protein